MNSLACKLQKYFKLQLYSRYENSQYYAVKLAIDTSIECIPTIKRLFSKYSANQLLYTFYCVTLINNIFYNNKFTPVNYRKFICKLGKFDFTKNDEIPFTDCKEYLHGNTQISCINDITRLSRRSLYNLVLLYSKLSFISIIIGLYFNRRPNIKSHLQSIAKSSIYLTLLPILHRFIVCNSHKLRGYNTIMTSQVGLTLGSLSFQVESDSRKKVINKFLTSLYINDVIGQIGLTNKTFWNAAFVCSMIYSISMRNSAKTLLALAF